MNRFLLSLLICFASIGNARPQIPLMPVNGEVKSPVPAKTRIARATLPRAYPPNVTTQALEKERPLSATGYGVELAVMGRSNKTQAEVAGMQLLYGLRFFARIPVLDNFFLVPSIGAFLKRDRAGNAGVNEYLIEAGGSLYYNLWLAHKLRLLVGGTGKVGYDIVSVSAGDSNSTEAASFRFRGGPAAGLALGVSPELSFVANFELTVGSGETARLQPGVAFGAIFYLP